MPEKTQLVLVPGLLCSPALWAAQVAGLGDIADITIADHTRHDTMPAIADAILAEAPERFALAGLSMGGYIAQQIVLQAPERVTGWRCSIPARAPIRPSASSGACNSMRWRAARARAGCRRRSCRC